MSKLAVQVEGIGKQYQLGLREKANQTFREAIVGMASAPLRRLKHLSGRDDAGKFWALRDISFDVPEGEVLGIIGHNGAGKSTLLKILSRITEPTEGRATIHGRVASLLEVGTGFHNELSGRENVYLNGAILGMSKVEIARKFDEIVEFSGVERFLDTPIKRYSSGMKVRLAFAVAAHLEPEILIIDEVLAVGDAEFQRKCLGKMQDVATTGRTVLFVSHNMAAVESLCNRAILLESGEVLADDQTGVVVGHYLEKGSNSSLSSIHFCEKDAPSNEHIRVQRVSVATDEGRSSGIFDLTVPLRVEIEFERMARERRLDVTLHFRTERDIVAFVSTTADRNECPIEWTENRGLAMCHVPANFLNSQQYRVSVLIIRDRSECIMRLDDIVAFDIEDHASRRGRWFGKREGAVSPFLEWNKPCLSTEPMAAK
ncbi:MAG: ATP-binding cassette domain-containing protein [Planctomycetaceae bacterium]|nr:ATP-binding cassette domain-containing protein [Planctomycetaceae bacterium]